MASRRIYITLNDEKEKDRIIISYLSQSYSEADAMKEAIYRLATNNIQSMQNDNSSTEKVQVKPKSNSKVKKDVSSKSDKRVRKGINNSSKDEKIPKVNCTEKEQKVSNDDVLLNLDDIGDEVHKEVQKDDVIKTNELEQLKKFM